MSDITERLRAGNGKVHYSAGVGSTNTHSTPTVGCEWCDAAATIDAERALADQLAAALLSWFPVEFGDDEDRAAIAAWEARRGR